MGRVVLNSGITDLLELVDPSRNFFEDIAEDDGLSAASLELPALV
jgi:hypothetical protein